MATVDDKKIIFSMVGVSKIIPQNHKQILKDIYLSFFYGAKIGIIGLNGAGKSTLMKIIAGLDQNYQGEVVFSPGYTVGYLPQEPQLDDDKTVIETVKEGVKVYLDESLKRFETVFPAAGSANSAIELTIPELEQYSKFDGWVDVCKDWRTDAEG